MLEEANPFDVHYEVTITRVETTIQKRREWKQLRTERDETPEQNRPQFGYVDDQWPKETRVEGFKQVVDRLDIHAVIRAVNGMDAEDPRRALADFLIAHSIPTGHGDTLDDLLLALGAWIQRHGGV